MASMFPQPQPMWLLFMGNHIVKHLQMKPSHIWRANRKYFKGSLLCPTKNFSIWMWTFYGDTSICCDVGMFVCNVYRLLVCWLCHESKCMRSELTREECGYSAWAAKWFATGFQIISILWGLWRRALLFWFSVMNCAVICMNSLSK